MESLRAHAKLLALPDRLYRHAMRMVVMTAETQRRGMVGSVCIGVIDPHHPHGQQCLNICFAGLAERHGAGAS